MQRLTEITSSMPESLASIFGNLESWVNLKTKTENFPRVGGGQMKLSNFCNRKQ